jgi:hypothetical protein
MQGVNTSAVPFFYHCQFSDGSAEDLVLGYSAFIPGEWVYVLHIPGDIPTSYIFGHADIKGTIICELPRAVGIGTALWERFLGVCQDPSELFLEDPPAHLMNIRYRSSGVSVSLITYQQGTGDWHVIVDRKGHEPFRTSFSPPIEATLTVSAAISPDLNNLYIVATAVSGTGKTGSYLWYVFNVGTKSWDLSASGNVPDPLDVGSYRPYYVDRDGYVAGYWATDSTSSNETVTEPEGAACTSSGEGTTATTITKSYTYIVGDKWSIITNEFSGSAARVSGVTLSDDIVTVDEIFSSANLLEFVHTYSWMTDGPGGFHKTREQILDYHAGEMFTVNVDGTDLTTTADLGLSYQFSGNADYLWESVDETNCHIVISYNFDDWYFFEGVKSIGVTPGGWVTRLESGYYENAGSMAPYEYESDPVSCYTPVVFPCPDMWYWYEQNRTTPENKTTNVILYPENLGEYYAIPYSFSSLDQLSGVKYTGIMVQQTQESTPAWHVYRNGVDVTAEIAECIGRPMSQLRAIYFRA